MLEYKVIKGYFFLFSFHLIMISMVRINVVERWYIYFLCVANITSQYYAFCVS